MISNLLEELKRFLKNYGRNFKNFYLCTENMKLSQILFQKNTNSLYEATRAKKELLGTAQSAIQKALTSYYNQMAQVSAASKTDFGIDLFTPAASFIDAAVKLQQAGKGSVADALNTYKNSAPLKQIISPNTKNPNAFDNKLKSLVKSVLSSLGARKGSGEEDPTAGGLAGRAKGDVSARMTNKSEEGKQLSAKLNSLRGDQQKKEYLQSTEFQNLIQKVDPQFLTKVKGMAKVNPEVIADVGGFRITAKDLLTLNEGTLEGISGIYNSFDSLKNTVSNFIYHLEVNHPSVGKNTVNALKQLVKTVNGIQEEFKRIEIPDKIATVANKQAGAAPTPAPTPAPAAAPANKIPPPDTNKLAGDVFGSIPTWKDYMANTPFGKKINDMKDYVAKLETVADPAKKKPAVDFLKTSFGTYIDNEFNKFKAEHPQLNSPQGQGYLKNLQTAIDAFKNTIIDYANKSS